MSLLKVLKGFIKPEQLPHGPTLAELRSLTKSQAPQDDNQVFIRELFSVLSTHCVCHQENMITVNLRLKDCNKTIEQGESVDFQLLFLDHPHQYGQGNGCQWQEARITVTRRRYTINSNNESWSLELIKFICLRSVMFQDQQQQPQSRPPRETIIPKDRFCELITGREHAQIRLAVSVDHLVLEELSPLSRKFILEAPSVSLAALLRRVDLTQPKRLLLSYFLAKAVWMFYDSAWMSKEWTKYTVHFMVEKWSQLPKAILINELFLSSQLGTTQSIPGYRKDDSKFNFRAHNFPNLLALGIMLLEVELQVNIEEYRMSYMGGDGQPTVNTDLCAAIEIFKKSELWVRMETYAVVKDIIENCLCPQPFKAYENNPSGLRNAMEQKIVIPLRTLYESLWRSAPEEKEVDPVELETQPGSVNPKIPMSRDILLTM